MEFKEQIAEINKSFTDCKSNSVSKVLSQIQTEFDADSIARKTGAKHYEDKSSKYYHMTVDEIKAMWERNGVDEMHYGRCLDDFIGFILEKEKDAVKLEKWKLDNNWDDDLRLKCYCQSFIEFYNDIIAGELLCKGGLGFTAREQQVFFRADDGSIVNGRFDALFWSESMNKWILFDWKSSKEIATENRWERLLGPCMHLDACNWNIYSAQLGIYRAGLLDIYKSALKDAEIECYIVRLSDKTGLDNKRYKVYETNKAFYDRQLINKIIQFSNKKLQLNEKN